MKPAEKYRAWKAHRPEKPIFRTILFSMMAVLLAEVILLSTGIGLTNVSGRLNQNAKQIVNMQVRNRASYLQDMLIKAQELTDISTTINNLTQQMLQDGTISLDTMDQSSEAADPLMEAAAPYLVSALRARPVTGIFLVINTHDLAEKKVGSPMPSVYLRDLDPHARPSERKADLMIERSSAAVVKKLGITTDKSWSTALSYRGLTSVKEMLGPMLYTTGNTKISELLRILQREKAHMVIVVDEYGGTEGLVTLEDIVEELVGEIWDEHEQEETPVRRLGPDSWAVDAGMDLEDFAAQFHIKTDSEMVSVSGWVMEQFGRVPEQGDSFDCGGLHVEVTQVENHRIGAVHVTAPAGQDAPQQAAG